MTKSEWRIRPLVNHMRMICLRPKRIECRIVLVYIFLAACSYTTYLFGEWFWLPMFVRRIHGSSIQNMPLDYYIAFMQEQHSFHFLIVDSIRHCGTPHKSYGFRQPHEKSCTQHLFTLSMVPLPIRKQKFTQQRCSFMYERRTIQYILLVLLCRVL